MQYRMPNPSRRPSCSKKVRRVCAANPRLCRQRTAAPIRQLKGWVQAKDLSRSSTTMGFEAGSRDARDRPVRCAWGFLSLSLIPALHSQLVPHLTWPESALFLVLLAASTFGFWWRFRKVWRIILHSKKDADFRIQPVARRVADFTWEVLLQGKVISQRPLPGIAHALVFWGFCVFALVTINHFAEGVQLGFLARGGTAGE